MDLISPLPGQRKKPLSEVQIEAEAAGFMEAFAKTGGEI